MTHSEAPNRTDRLVDIAGELLAVDTQNPPGDTAVILADIGDCLDDHPAVSIADVSRSVGSYESVDSPLVRAVTETAAEVADDRIYRRSATGGGDAKTFRQAGIPAVEFAFGTDTVHAVDEYTTLQALEWNAAVYERLPAVFAEHSQ